MAAGGFFALDRASGAGYSVSRTEGTRVPEKYVLPIVMLVAWPSMLRLCASQSKVF